MRKVRGRRDLLGASSLPLALLADGRLEFGGDLPPVSPLVRTKDALADVLLDPDGDGPAEAYYVYRGVCFPRDRALFAAEGLSYDVTVLRPGTLGGEFVKTFGHYHPPAPGRGQAYPEVYEVLSGRGHFLLQKPAAPPARAAALDDGRAPAAPPDRAAAPDDGRAPAAPPARAAARPAVLDAVLVEAGPGEKVLIPPGYGHVTINPGDEWLVIANLVAVEFTALYEPYRQARGAAYHELAGEGFRLNPLYGGVPPLRRLATAHHPELGVVPGVPLYRAFLAAPDRFAFLRDPLKQDARRDGATSGGR